MYIAVTRPVSPAIQHCELSYLPRLPIDLVLAERQHQAYQDALTRLGCEVVSLPPLPEQADAVFVEDTAVVVHGLAVIARPGAESRRGETESSAELLAGYRKLAQIHAPGTLDGGDVLLVGRTLYVGQTPRSNAEGTRQLAELVAPLGYRVVPVEVTGCLHLKTAATQVAERTLLINPAWVDKDAFEGLDFIEVDPAESHAGNAVKVGEALIYPRSFPRTRARLEARGLKLELVDMSETEKAEGGVTCCSIVFWT